MKRVLFSLVLVLMPTLVWSGYDPYRLKMAGYSPRDIKRIIGGRTDEEQQDRKFRIDYAQSLRRTGYEDEDVDYILDGGPDKEREVRKYELDVAEKYRMLGRNADEADRLAAVLARQTRIAIAEAERQQPAQPRGMIPTFASPLPVPAFKFGAKTYGPLVAEEALRQGIDPLLGNALTRHESGYNARALSPKGAMGLMQLMPGTARMLGVQNAFDPRQNVQGGMKYLAEQLRTFGRVELALAAYNAGPEAVRKYRGIPPYGETIKYVQKIMRTYAELKSANKLYAQR